MKRDHKNLPQVHSEYNPILATTVSFVIIDGEPWFLGTKCAEALGYQEAHKAVRETLDKGGLKQTPLKTEGGVQEVVLISEGGLYELCIAASKFNEAAATFKRWIFDTLLPTIRRTGTFISDAATPEQIARSRELQLVEKIIRASKGERVRIGNIIKDMLGGSDGVHKFRIDSWPYIHDKLTGDKRFVAKEEGMRRIATACEEYSSEVAGSMTDMLAGLELQQLLTDIRTGQAHLLKRREGQHKNTIKKLRANKNGGRNV